MTARDPHDRHAARGGGPDAAGRCRWSFTAGTEVLPGDAATAVLGREATPAAVAKLRHDFGLDRPFTTRYLDWLAGFVHGDLGRSLPSGEHVSALTSTPCATPRSSASSPLPCSIPLLLLARRAHRGQARRHARSHLEWRDTLALIAVPEFVIGSLLSILRPGSAGAAGSVPDRLVAVADRPAQCASTPGGNPPGSVRWPRACAWSVPR